MTANNTWTKYTASFNSGSNTVVVIIICDNMASNYTSYYDDFKLY